MHPKYTSFKKSHDVKITRNNLEKGKPPVLDIEISGGWSLTPRRETATMVIDQIFHFSVFACLAVLTCYIFIVHRLLYYETLNSTDLKNRFDFLFKLNEDLYIRMESTKSDLKIIKSEHQQLNDVVDKLKTELAKKGINTDHLRPRRSTNQKDCNRARKRNRCNRTRTIETVAVQFRGLTDVYEQYPMEGLLGPWFVDFDLGTNPEESGVTRIENNRKLEISKAGLYFIYSQVTYLNTGTSTSYSINVLSTSNETGKIVDKSTALCSTVGRHNYKAELSCYTSTVRLLYPKDIVYLHQYEKNQTISFEDEMTYIGLIRLSDL